ncbi:40S ribosomal protein S15 [Capsicum annuum]|nr:40S ribosomal protein S15 [Capsicum annuum]
MTRMPLMSQDKTEALECAYWMALECWDLFSTLQSLFHCQNAIFLTKDQIFHERTKHIDVRYHFVSGIIVRGDILADFEGDVATGQPKKRTFKKFSYRGVDLDALLDMSTDELVKLFPARPRRRFQRGLKRKPMALIKKLRKAKREAPPGEKPEVVRTHLRNMVIVPEMIGSVIGIYNGKTFNQIEVKPEMISHYLAEFSISYKPVKHGRPGIGATHSSRFIPLK